MSTDPVKTVELDHLAFKDCLFATHVNPGNPAFGVFVATLAFKRGTWFTGIDRWEITTRVYLVREMTPETALDQAWVDTQEPMKSFPMADDWKLSHVTHHNDMVASFTI